MAKRSTTKSGTGGAGKDSGIDIAALARLARIELTPTEKGSFARDLENILGYVSELEAVSAEASGQLSAVRNVMREDADPYEAGAFTADLLAEAPAVHEGYIAVKPIIEK